VRLQFLFRPARGQFRRARRLPVFAGLVLMLSAMALASDTQKLDNPAAATAKSPVDPTCKVPDPGASDKADPEEGSTDSSPAESEARPAEDSLKIKLDLAGKPRSEDESAQESTKKESADTAVNEKAKTAAPLQCERPAAKKDLTLPTSGKDGSPE